MLKKVFNSKLSNKEMIKRITSIVIAIVFFTLFIFTVRKVYIAYNEPYKYSAYASISEERQELWNKMKVSSAIISKRTTGTSFNSSSSYESSNMNGIDISPTDEYVKSGDYVYYDVELNIDANTDIEGVTDATEFYGGVIKYKVTLPTNESGSRLLIWNNQNWMSNAHSENNSTVYYGEYQVPDNINLVGAIQQLSFSMSAPKVIAEMDKGPTFEFWMEGNEPDNEEGHTSNIPSRVIQDGELKITAQESAVDVVVQDGYFKKIGYKDGKLGQYWVIGIYAYARNSYSYGYVPKKLDSTITKIRLEHYAKNLSPSGTSNSGWVKNNPGENLYDDTIGNASIIAYNRNGDVNENAYPNETSNFFNGAGGFRKEPYTSNGQSYDFDSGIVGASLENGILTITNDNIDISYMDYILNNNSCLSVPYFYSDYLPGQSNTSTSLCSSNTLYYYRDSIEIFVPYTELGVTDRDYQIKAVAYEIETTNSKTSEKNNYSSSSTVSATYSDQAGNIFDGKITINSSQYRYIRFGSLNTVNSYFSASKEDYKGEERLINIDNSFAELKSEVSYNSNGSSTAPDDLVVKYGVYKTDPLGGLDGAEGVTPTKEINVSDVEDFYWYESKSAAETCADLKENGVVGEADECTIASVHISNPSFVCDGSEVRYSFNISTKDNLIEQYKEGAIVSGALRQKIRIFKEGDNSIENSLSYYYDNNEDSYTPAIFNEYLSVTSSPVPLDAGVSIAAYGDYPSLSTSTVDKNGNDKVYFNISDDMFYYILKPKIYTNVSNGKITHDSYQILARFPNALTLNESNTNISPTKTFKDNSYNYALWEFENCEINGNLPGSCDNIDDSITELKIGADISPLTQDNSSLYSVFYYASGYTANDGTRTITDSETGEKFAFHYYSNTGRTVYITNLSGSYTRIKSSLNSASPNEPFVIDNSVYNNSQGSLTDVKTIQVLPRTGDSYGSNYNGNYTIKVKKLLEGQKIYYTTLDETENGITHDANGKITIENVDLENDERWINVQTGDTIPASARAIASIIPKIDAISTESFSYEFLPKDNKTGDIYGFKMFASSGNLSSSIATNTTVVKVYDRIIEGFAFNDKNRNDIYDVGEEYSNLKIDLYNDENKLIETTTTNSDGSYTFSSLPKDNYYVSHKIDSNYEFVLKNAGEESVSSVINPDGKSDSITKLNVLLEDKDAIVTNINLGLRKKEATLTIHHYVEGTTTKLADDETSTVYWGDTYTTSPATVDSNYELVATPENASGTISGNTEVTYYYRLKSATITVHHYIEDTTTKLADDVIINKKYTEEYTTSPATVDSNYELVATPENASGTVSGNVEVTYYYRLKTATITVHHYIEETTTELADDVVFTKKYTEKYTTSPATVDSNYELVATPANASGTVSGNVEVTYYYRLKTATITVHHYIEETTTELADDVVFTKKYTEKYTTSPATVNKNYELVATPSNASGTVSGNVEVIYYYRLKSATLIVNHYIEGTTTKLSETVTKNVHWGDTYTTSPATVDSNYELVATPENASGTIGGNVEVIYYYRLKSATITVHHYIEGTTTKLADDVVINKKYTEKYTTSPATVDKNYELVATPANASGTVSGNVTVTYYYRLKTATITVHHYIEGTTTKLADDVTINKKYTEKYTTSPATVDKNYELVATPANASGTVSGNVTVTYYYRLKTATITVHHYIEGTTTKLADDVIINKKYTEKYTTSPSDKVSNNYELVATPANASGTVSGNVTVTYYYRLKSATITVHHYIEGTTTKLADDVVINKKYTEKYTTSPATVNKNYELVATPSNASGTVNGNIIVTYYYRLKSTTLTVNYYIEGTTTKLADSIVKNVHWGDEYETSPSDKVSNNYELVATPSNASGIISANSVVVNYYYRLKSATITVHHYIEGTTTKLADDVVINKKYTEKYTTSPATVDSNYELVATPSNASGTVNGNVTVTYYYRLKSATITVHHYIEGTTTKLADDVVINKKYTEKYTTSPATVNKNYELVATPANASGTVSGNVTVTYYYRLKSTTLTVNYYIEGTTTKLTDSIVKNVHWGDEYETSPSDKVSNNYELVATPENASGTISANSVVVNYYYRLKSATLVVNHYIEGTTDKLADTETSTVHWGDKYTTSKSNDVSSNYELVNTPSNANGTVSGDITVNYYYRLKTGTIKVHYYIEGTTTKLSDDVVFTKKYTEKYETSAADDINSNYELVATPENASGTVSGNVTVIYYYRLKSATLTVHHYIEGTTTSLAADEIKTVYWGENYTTSKSSDVSTNYELASVEGTANGTVSGNIEVTYFYKLKTATLTVKHLELSTNKELAPPVSSTVYYGNNYTTSVSDKVTANYELHSKSNNFEGTVSTKTIEVIYYYQKKDSLLETTVNKTGPDEISNKKDPVPYKVTYEAKISDYIGPVSVTITDSLPYSIDEEKSQLDGGIYNAENKTITWTYSKESIDASVESKTISIEKNISLVYKDILSTDKSMINSVSGHIILDDKEKTIEDQTITYLKITGKIIVHHYLEGTTKKVFDDVESIGLVGETYISEALKKEGYLLKKEPENKNHIYQDETLEVIYEYEKIIFNIVTKVESGKGSITGDETIYYGEDSTKDNIIIKPSEGYQVSHIFINKEEVFIEDCKNGCILNSFVDVQEDKEIVVQFTNEFENPNTSSIIKIISIIGLTILTIISVVLIRKYKPLLRRI